MSKEKIYKCPHCKEYETTDPECYKGHVRGCRYNPIHHNCFTCGHDRRTSGDCVLCYDARNWTPKKED